MSIKAKFTRAEWEQLQLTLAEVTNAMIGAQPGGEIRENVAHFGNVEAVLEEFHNTQLVHLLFVQSEEEAKDLQANLERGNRTATAARMDLLRHCRESIALLRQKGLPETDIEAFRGATVALAEKVAHDSKEGGFLGIGGERVGEAESELIQAIRDALA